MQWHQLDHTQAICTSLQTDNHTNTPSLNCYRPDALPDAQPTLATSTQYCSCQSTSAAWTGAQQQTTCTLLLLLINETCLGHWVTGSMGHFGLVIFHVRATRTPFWPGVRPEFFFGFWKKRPKCKTSYIWNAEMTKVIVRCLLLDWNHWMSVHAMNFYFTYDY